MTGVFLQARLESTRLTNKALLELGGRTVIEQAMLQLRRIPATHHVLLTDSKSCGLLQRPAERCGFKLFVGSEQNVLERFVGALRRFGVDEIVRATGDNPLVSWELARMALALRRREEADYFGFDGPPLGTGVEVVRSRALERAFRESGDSYEQEHVTPYLYRNRNLFRVVRRRAPDAYCMPAARVTMDTADDYRRISSLYDSLYSGEPVPVLRLIAELSKSGSEPSEEENAYSSGA